MPASPVSIFNQKATEKLRSPDDLDKYVRVTNASVWAILGACVALLAGLLAWGVFGTISTSVTATATMVDGKAFCFLDAEETAKVHVDDVASVGGERMTVEAVTPVPLSREETKAILKSDYLVSTLVGGNWAYQVTFKSASNAQQVQLAEGVPIKAVITTERVAPISLILSNRG